MFAAILDRLRGHSPSRPLPELDARLAVGALLVRIAQSDRHYAFEEIAQIDKVLAHRFGLGPVEAMKMRADAERLEAVAPGTGEYTGLVQAAVPYDDRLALFGALWDVALADRALQPEETAMLTSLAEALGIAPDDAGAIAAQHSG